MSLNIYSSIYPNSFQQNWFNIKPTLPPKIYENYNTFTLMKYKQRTLETIHEVNENYNPVKISYV